MTEAGISRHTKPARRNRLLLGALLTLALLPSVKANTAAQTVLAKIATTDLAVPLVVESSDEDDQLVGTVDGTINVPFERVRTNLQHPQHWCELLTLHLNVKSCTYASANREPVISVYTGRKEFERPEDADRIDMHFQARENLPERLLIDLTAKTGPMGTYDYLVSAAFTPVDAATTLVRFEYRYGLSWRAQLAIGAYLATAGSEKVGFTRTATTGSGDIEYIDGMRGMVERNAVRYYLALVAFFANTDMREFDAHAAAAQWFDLTARFPRQLHEVEREEYLSAKTREYREQERLQATSVRSSLTQAEF